MIIPCKEYFTSTIKEQDDKFTNYIALYRLDN